MNERIKYYIYLSLSFIIPSTIFLLVIIAAKITPFGNHNLAITDAKYYINSELFHARLLLGQENPLYSFKNGIGGNEWSILAWGGFSFGGILSIFGTLENIPTIFTFICLVNTSICGITMYLLLRYLKGDEFQNIIFSTSYALIGFNVVNIYQTLFFLGPQLLPVVILGLIKIVRNECPITYILSLAFCTFFNFYFAFHIGVASFIICIAYLYSNYYKLGKEVKRIAFTWFFSSVIAVLLAAPSWLPALKAYTGGGRLDQTAITEFEFTENMPFIQIFSKLFTGANSTSELVNGLPNIFCGILVIALDIIYFINNAISIRRKCAACLVVVFYLLTFYINTLTLIMHGGTHTNWFPYRYSYVFSFLLICIAYEEFIYIADLTWELVKRCGIFLLICVILIFSNSYEFVSGAMAVIDLFLLFLMWLGYYLYKIKPEKASKLVLYTLILILVGINLYTNLFFTIDKTKDWELDLQEYQQNTFVSGALVDAVHIADDSFFRMEKDISESGSIGADPYLYGYNGVSHSGPTERMFIHQGLNRIAVNWFDMRHWYSEGIPAATDTLLGLKYLISNRDLTKEKGYVRRAEIEGSQIFENPSPLNFAILTTDDVEDIELSDNAFENLNIIWKTMVKCSNDVFISEPDISFSAHNAIELGTVTSTEINESISQDNIWTTSGENAKHSAVETSETYIEYSFIAKRDGPAYIFDTSIPSSSGGISVPSVKYCDYCKTGDLITGKIDLFGADYLTADFLRGYCANLAFSYADNEVLSNHNFCC